MQRRDVDTRRIVGRRAVLALLVGAALCPSPTARAQGGRVAAPLTTVLAGRRPSDGLRHRLGGYLAELLDADAAGDARRYWQAANNGEAVFDAQGRIELQLHLRAGVLPAAIDDARLRRIGGAVGVRGLDLVNVWIPLQEVPALLRLLDAEILGARLPWRPTVLGAGKAISKGADQVAPPELRTCTGNDGKGATVVVLDTGFEKWKESRAAGELPGGPETAEETGGTHGTMCAQVVADVAPGATILPVPTQSFAGVQQLVQEIEAGNPKGIAVISHSVIWFGQSFGRHEGPICAVTDRVRKRGVAWVNASGNSGGGGFWTGVWTDANKDNHQDFGKDGALLRFRHHGGEIKLVLDWDDYKPRETNLDLALYVETGSGLELVSESNQQQGLFVPPVETITVPKAAGGIYAAVVTGKKTRPDLRLRIVSLGGGSDSLSVWHNAGNVYDPASCDGVLTVGALPAGNWDKGILASYSSYGPTVDGRQKPEVVAPTQVDTSLGSFGGTSAACPHAAGAVALAVAMTTTTPVEIADAIRDAAQPIGPNVPHPAWGWGRVVLDKGLSGWQCEAGSLELGCVTACGSQGMTSCDATCRFGACEPPVETCAAAGAAGPGNGVDEDCDGLTDEGCVLDDGDADAATEETTTGDADETGAIDAPADVATDADAPSTRPSVRADGGCSASPSRGPAGAAPLWTLLGLGGAATLWRRRLRIQRT